MVLVTPDDPRHGTPAGYQAGCPSDCCRWPASRERKAALTEALAGRPRRVPAIGMTRRLRALFALGWTWCELAERLGVTKAAVHHRAMMRDTWCRRSTAEQVAALYDELSMTVPSGARADNNRADAIRRGWVPPLAWDDETIDDPAATPYQAPSKWQRSLPGPTCSVGCLHDSCMTIRGRAIDEVAVRRRIAGDHTIELSITDLAAAVRTLHRAQYSDGRIADVLGIADRTVGRVRARLQLAAVPETERLAVAS